MLMDDKRDVVPLWKQLYMDSIFKKKLCLIIHFFISIKQIKRECGKEL